MGLFNHIEIIKEPIDYREIDFRYIAVAVKGQRKIGLTPWRRSPEAVANDLQLLETHGWIKRMYTTYSAWSKEFPSWKEVAKGRIYDL